MRTFPKEKEKIKQFLLHVHEGVEIELKKAKQLPKSFWETYSAFSNTNGGFIVLGVEEATPFNEIIGVENPAQAIKDLWNLLSNTSKVSYRTIQNEDVTHIRIENKDILIICVHEAPNAKKPVYLDNKWENSFIRTGDGDRKISLEELRIFIRNASTNNDSLIAEGFTIDDLDALSISSFKEQVSIRYPSKKFNDLTNEQFLLQIGCCIRNRTNNNVQVKRGALLFLGRYYSIRELYPHFHLDYFNRQGNNPRWSDRLATDEPNEYEMNIYNFYRMTYGKIKSTLQDSFQLDSQQLRLPIGRFDDSIREGLINCLAHADYDQAYPPVKIELYNGYFKFLNPGRMLIPEGQFFIGGESQIRNEIIMSLFRLIGASERQGFGGPLIFQTAKQTESRIPQIMTNMEQTELTIWNVDLVDSYPSFSQDEKNIFRFIVKSMKAVSYSEIKNECQLTEYIIRKTLKKLEAEKIIERIGINRGTKYQVRTGSGEMVAQLQFIVDSLKKNISER